MLPRSEVGDAGELVRRLGATAAAPDSAGAEESLLVCPPLLEGRLSGVVSRPSGILREASRRSLEAGLDMVLLCWGHGDVGIGGWAAEDCLEQE